MSLQTKIHSLVIRVADEFKTVNTRIGNLSSLSTADKSTLVAAINELKTAVTALALIDDQSPGSTTTTFSASKIVTVLDALRAQILGGADSAYDTLLELQQALQNDQTGIAALTAAIDKRVRFDAAQTLSNTEQTQARANIGAVASTDIGNTDTDFVALFEAQLIA